MHTHVHMHAHVCTHHTCVTYITHIPACAHTHVQQCTPRVKGTHMDTGIHTSHSYEHTHPYTNTHTCNKHTHIHMHTHTLHMRHTRLPQPHFLKRADSICRDPHVPEPQAHLGPWDQSSKQRGCSAGASGPQSPREGGSVYCLHLASVR